MSDGQLAAEVLQSCSRAGLVDAGRQFLAINRGGNLRWLIPADTPRAGPALSAWRPYGFVSSVAWKVIRATLPVLGGLLPRASAPGGTKKHELEGLEPVIFVGTPGLRRKLVCHMVERNGVVRAIVKVPLGSGAGRSIAHEAYMLQQLATQAPHVAAPRLVSIYPETGMSTQTWMGGVPSRRQFGAHQAAFLQNLSRPDGSVSIVDRLQGLSRRAEVASLQPDLRGLVEQLLAMPASDAALPSCWVHGDFAPWNLKLSRDKMVAVDWEEGEERGLPLQDLSHYFASLSYLFRLSGTPFARMLASDAAKPLLREYRSDVVSALFRHYCLAAALRSFERGEEGFGRYLLANLVGDGMSK